MEAKTHFKILFLAGLLTLSTFAEADYPQSSPAQCNNNSNNGYDPRVPPAGTYTTKNRDGSSNTIYTTGTKNPAAIIDSGCNSALLPQIYVNQPSRYLRSRK